jgi:hypothetical protein
MAFHAAALSPRNGVRVAGAMRWKMLRHRGVFSGEFLAMSVSHLSEGFITE